MLFDYDDTNINSVLNYAKKIEDLTFRDILVECKKYLADAEKGKKMNRPLEFINSLKNDKLLTSENSKGELPIRMNFILDEFANFTKIDTFQSMLTVSRR